MGNHSCIDQLVLELHQRYREPWTVASMADYCRLSIGYFSHLFRERTGCAPLRYLTDLRIEKAKVLISTGTMNLSAIAPMVGFVDPLYFSRVFKKSTGVPPTLFLQSQLTQQTPEWYLTEQTPES